MDEAMLCMEVVIMPALQVKDCPAMVYDRLRECAAHENRSISQQALTIIQEYLGLRGSAASPVTSGPPAVSSVEERMARRRMAFQRIEELRPLPITDASPGSAELLDAVRAEDAR